MTITKLYSFPEVQRIIGGEPPPSLSTLKRWAREGRLPVIRLSARVIRIDKEALEKFFESRGSGCGAGGSK